MGAVAEQDPTMQQPALALSLALPSVVQRRTGSSPTPSSATSTTSAWPRSRKRSSALTDSCLTQPTPTRSSATIPSTWTAETENMFRSLSQGSTPSATVPTASSTTRTQPCAPSTTTASTATHTPTTVPPLLSLTRLRALVWGRSSP